MASVVIADDHAIVIEGLSSALDRLEGYDLVGIAYDGIEAVEQVKALKPDVIIMDIAMPRMNGVTATRKIKDAVPETRVIIYTMFADKEYVLELFRAGIDGYVLKRDPVSDLMKAIKAVNSGGTYFSTQAPRVLSDHLRRMQEKGHVGAEGLESLSEREYEVFICLADGKPLKSVARELRISSKTVESHKHNILAKLRVESVVGMTKLAMRLGLIDD